MLRWMFWEQYNHEPNIATVRFWLRYVGLEALSGMQREQIPVKRKAGNEALKLMDGHLAAGNGSSATPLASPTSACSPTRTSRTRRISTSNSIRT